MKIYDTLTKRKVELVPAGEGKIGIYLCGPTVYDYGHLGHGRSAIVFDVLRRYLAYKGYSVTFVRNWTDIDDKTIERASREGVSVKELTERFIKIYEEDFKALNILEPDVSPKPTEHIPEIIGVIERLFRNGHAYALPDGVYFDISSYGEYGKLSGQNLAELVAGARVEVLGAKRNPGDFALWKFEKPGEPSWESPWGKGRPGWHVECSAMSMKYLGEEFDIHCGGQDLTFPHHEDEIAQSRGAGFGFARHWMHNGFLNINNEKMSKSLGNFFTLRDAFKTFQPMVVRFFLMSAHYRAPLNFSEESLKSAQQALARFDDFIRRVREAENKGDRDSPSEGAGEERTTPRAHLLSLIERARTGFEEGLDDDLNASRSLGALSDFLREANTLIDRGEVTPRAAADVIDFMRKVDSVLGVFTFEQEILPEEIERMIEERLEARKTKDWVRADRIRKLLKGRGIVLEDTPQGTRWKRFG